MKRRSFFGLLPAATPVVKKQPQGTQAFANHALSALAGPSMAPRTSEGMAYLVNQNPDQSELLFRALNLKGELPRLIDPRFNVSFQGEDFTRTEYVWLRRGQISSVGDVVAAVAGQQGFVEMVGSTGRLLLTEQIIISNFGATANGFRIGMGTTVGAGVPSNPQVRDDREAPNPPVAVGTSARATTGTTALPVIGAQDYHVLVPPTNTLILPVNFVQSGRANLHVVCNVVNTTIGVWFVVRERELLPSET